MNQASYFRNARLGDTATRWLFWIGAGLSAALLWKPCLTFVLAPPLIVVTVGGLVTDFFGRQCQVKGNGLLRRVQLGNALGVALAADAQKGYYNTNVEASVLRLAATTFENVFFTARILRAMLTSQRVLAVIYILALVLLLSLRAASLDWLVFITQGVFSAALIAYWLRMELFRYRASAICDQLHQFFLGRSNSAPAEIALILDHFSSYECAKDEASMPLNERIFRRLNPRLSREWLALARRLGIAD